MAAKTARPKFGKGGTVENPWLIALWKTQGEGGKRGGTWAEYKFNTAEPGWNGKTQFHLIQHDGKTKLNSKQWQHIVLVIPG